ncbi:hypothetical protein [Variovorax sp. JS1663]|uniref:hypothetical protein n=1 Tax=Variovorax sp. JS1663 TaxID=1851577 RepID=UPI000B667AE7|nr:hypothetical protein [Variovorax sp. JS1663]OUM04309.1 hypothetical protein A8M77_00955 [Variovorax sp. JS1663]
MNVQPPKDPRELLKHFSQTYFSLRMGLAVLAFAFPLVLYVYGKLRHGLDLQPSMSAYFWAAGAVEQCASFPMRTLFVGFLFAIGVGLYLYKGITTLENYLLNAAGICAALVAIYPERLTHAEALTDERVAALFKMCPAIHAWAAAPPWPVHYIAAITLFMLLAVVAWFCASKTLDYLPVGQDAAKYRRLYRLVAIGMVVFPIPGFLAALLLGKATHWVFFVEAAGIVTFGIYWAIKSRELSLSQLETNPADAAAHAIQRRAAPAADGTPPGIGGRRGGAGIAASQKL